MGRFVRFCRLHWVPLVLSVAFVVIGAVALLWPTRPPPFVALNPPVRMPVPFRDYFGRWIPARAGWAWAWRVEQAVFGKRKPVNVFAEVAELGGVPSVAELPNVIGEPPTFSVTNGPQVWLLTDERLKTLRDKLEKAQEFKVISRPRVSTADGITCSLFTGSSMVLDGKTNQVGSSFDCFTYVRGDSTDLIARFANLEVVTNGEVATGQGRATVETNFDAAVRMQVPKGYGFLMFDGRSRRETWKSLGVFVEVR